MNEFLALFTRASKLLRGAADEAMSRHGVRVGQNLVLEVLWAEDGLTPGELASRLHIATPTVVKSANRMAAAGLLRRAADPADARLVRLQLTDRARGLQGVIEAERDALDRRATATLTSAEREHLRTALIKIIAQFTDDAGTERPAAGADVAGGAGVERPGGAGAETPGGAGPGAAGGAGVERPGGAGARVVGDAGADEAAEIR